MRVLGIDPGLQTIGIGLVETQKHGVCTALDWMTIETKTGLPLGERLREIAEDLTALLRETKPDLAVVETLFFQTNKKSAMIVAHARGVILETLARHGVPVIEPNPLSLKLTITGDGRADKRQVTDMVVRTLKLTERPSPDDAADALALALYGCLTGILSHASL